METFLHDTAITFDRAVEVTRTAIPFGFKLQPHVRPYVIDGAQEMICEGSHREAMWWILFVLMIANSAIQQDAPEAEQPFFQAKLDRLFQELGFATPHDVQARLQGARVVAREMFMLADEMVEQQPEGQETVGAE